MSIYRQFGIEPIINASGTLTRLGGAIMPDAVVEAMKLASQSTVPLDELHAAGARLIARATGAESGLVTGGASASLTLGAAAILAGRDLARIHQLPDTSRFPDEFLIAADQRNGYDHAARAAGAHLIDVGMNEIVAGSGVRGVEIADFEQALTQRTAGILYVYRENATPSLADVVKWGHEHRLPILVDAAAELTRRTNLREIPATGADLIAFSGGKAIRGPQATGILCGRRELIESAAMQMLDMDVPREEWSPPNDFIDPANWPALPRQGIGRGLKVSKEQLVGLLVALELFIQGDTEGDRRAIKDRADRIIASLRSSSIEAYLGQDDGDLLGPILIPIEKNLDALLVRLRAGNPPIYARGNDDRASLLIRLACVRPDQDSILIDRLREAIKWNETSSPSPGRLADR